MINNSSEMMDDTFENSQIRRMRFSNYFKNEADSKLKNMNMQEDSSYYSDSIKKTANHSFKKRFQQPQDISDLLQQSGCMNDTNVFKYQTNKLDKLNSLSYENSIPKYEDDSNIIILNNYQQNEESNIISPKSPITKCETVTKVNSIKNIEENAQEQFNILSQERMLRNKHSKRTQLENKSLLQKLNIQILMKLKFYIMRYYKFHTVNGRTQEITEQIRNIINDYSDIQFVKADNSFKYIQLFQYVQHKLKYLLKIPLLNPQNPFCLLIKVLITIFNCFSLYFFSLIIIFHPDYNYYQQFSLFLSLVWCIDIGIQLNTSPFDLSGQLKERKIILQKYLKQNAFFDLTPLIFININPTTITARFVFYALVFLKVRNTVNDLNYIQKRICMVVRKYYIVQLINLAFKLFLIGHIIACLWYLIGQIELKVFDFQHTWYNDIQEDINHWLQYYVWSLYWSLTLMTTGSNIANTMLQASFTTVILLFTTISFGYFLNIVSIILSEIDETSQQRRKDINVLNEYMRQKNISQNLQANVNIDLEYYYEKNYKKNYEDNKQALDKLSLDLRNSLLKEYNTQILNNISLLRNNFSSEVLEELTLFMKEEYYQPNQMISKQSENNQNFMIYILSGKIELIQNQSKEFMKNSKNIYLEKDEIFGEQNFFSGLSNQTSIKSVEFCKIIKIERENFINIIKQSQKDFEVFCEIKDKILLYQDYTDIYNSCSGCNSKFHYIEDCSYVHFNRQQGLQKARIQQKQTQSRQNFERSKKTSIKAIKEAKKLQLITFRARKSFLFNHMSTTQRFDLQFQTIDQSDSSNEENEQLNSFQNQNTEYVQENQSQNNLEGDLNFMKSQINNELINKIPQSIVNYPEPSIQQKILLTGSLSSLNDFEDISDVLKHYIQEYHQQNGSLKILADSKKKFSQENIKFMMKENYEGHKNFQANDYQNQRDHNDLDLNLMTQKLAPMTKNYNRRSILKSQKQSNSHLEKEENRQSLKKSIIHLKKVPTTIPCEKLEDNNVNTVQSTPNKLYTIDDQYYNFDQYNPWEFDCLKEYKNYFVSGNYKYILSRILKFQKKQKNRKKSYKHETILKKGVKQ